MAQPQFQWGFIFAAIAVVEEMLDSFPSPPARFSWLLGAMSKRHLCLFCLTLIAFSDLLSG
jgi:hypothetical protein